MTAVDTDLDLTSMAELLDAIPCGGQIADTCLKSDPLPAEWVVMVSGQCLGCGGDTGGIQTLMWCDPCKTDAEARGWMLGHLGEDGPCGPLYLTIHLLERINNGGPQ